MKKYLSLLVMGLLMVIPFTVKAGTAIKTPISCVDETNGNKTCTIEADTDEYSTTIKLKEFGGAEITDITGVDWTITSKPYSDNTYTVEVTGTETGEGIKLFTFTYKPSGLKNCHVEVSSGTKTYDTPTPQKQTGASLPIVALGTLAVIAGGAYVLTKNKAKMYRI